jgi:hypothetical protein
MKDLQAEKAVLKRYGKVVEIDRVIITNKEGEVIQSTCEWTSRGKKYTLTENLANGLTSKVVLKSGDKERIFDNHLVAEVNLIDLISEE